MCVKLWFRWRALQMGFGGFHSLVRYLGSVWTCGTVMFLSDGDEEMKRGRKKGKQNEKNKKPTLGGLGVQICIDFFSPLVFPYTYSPLTVWGKSYGETMNSR